MRNRVRPREAESAQRSRSQNARPVLSIVGHAVAEPLEDRRLLAFSHPGLLFTQAAFDRMAAKVNAGAQPWLFGWNALTSDGYSQLAASPRPLQTVIRGGTGDNYNQMVIDINARTSRPCGGRSPATPGTPTRP